MSIEEEIRFIHKVLKTNSDSIENLNKRIEKLEEK